MSTVSTERLAKIFVDPEQVEQLRLAQTPEQVHALLDGVRPA